MAALKAGPKERAGKVANGKKPAVWIAVALILCAAAVLLYPALSGAGKTEYERSGRKLSDLSEQECLAFIASRGIGVPEDLNHDGIGEFVASAILRAEEYPASPAGYSYTVTMDFSERIRRAVNEYYGADGGEYFIEGKWG